MPRPQDFETLAIAGPRDIAHFRSELSTILIKPLSGNPNTERRFERPIGLLSLWSRGVGGDTRHIDGDLMQTCQRCGWTHAYFEWKPGSVPDTRWSYCRAKARQSWHDFAPVYALLIVSRHTVTADTYLDALHDPDLRLDVSLYAPVILGRLDAILPLGPIGREEFQHLLQWIANQHHCPPHQSRLTNGLWVD